MLPNINDYVAASKLAAEDVYNSKQGGAAAERLALQYENLPEISTVLFEVEREYRNFDADETQFFEGLEDGDALQARGCLDALAENYSRFEIAVARANRTPHIEEYIQERVKLWKKA